ncbi:class II histone deacetylase [Haliea sp. E1-2-M8]|uniref:class II histone deacetylase n=1 Tax=Haliea sp. E1-2-M8 TaxID=3064706 RepID=UPI0027252798|nr:class II histone deacetylase [Haliea sp. E1-2-M8]MDO8861954.1 class II histone deacetylase [Haliea sp. E1-2-M8]
MQAATRKTGFVAHELYMWHNTGNYAGPMPYGNPVQPDTHAENPETKRRFRNLLEVAGLTPQLHVIVPREATEEEILRFHTREHLEKVRTLSAGVGGDAGPFTPLGRGSYEIAMLSAGGVLAALEALMAGEVDNAYALVRPPGHHALADMGMGFCLFGNAAIAGLHAFEHFGLERIAFVDWDVHHGNGTQSAFYDDPRALTISVHQDNCFPPDSGYRHENGEGAGAGFNINVPLPPGSGVGAYEEAWDRVVIPALDRFQPQLIIVPSGFDAGAYDPLGRMQMHSDGYRSLARKLRQAAERHCGGRLLMCHEGGYNTWTVPFFGLAVMEELSGAVTGTVDPFLEMHGALGGQDLQPHQAEAIALAEALLHTLPCRS